MTRFAKTLIATAAAAAFAAPAFAEPPVENDDALTYEDGVVTETAPEAQGAVIFADPVEDVAGEVETADDGYEAEDGMVPDSDELDGADDTDEAEDGDASTTGETDDMWSDDDPDEDPLD